jgi:hypothetical protein
MRPRKLVIKTNLFGIETILATLTISKFAEFLQPKTTLVCPKCGEKPEWNGGYDCNCCPICGKQMECSEDTGVNIAEHKEVNIIVHRCKEHGIQNPSHFNHWSQLKRIDSHGVEVKQVRLTGEGDVTAYAFVMDLPEFSKYADATADEYGVIVKDDGSARAMKKLLIAMEKLGKVIVMHFNDTYEERVAILTTSISKRILLKEIIPLNLLDQKETMRVSFEGITDKDVQEAEEYLKHLPKATEDLLYVHDYRLQGVEAQKVSPKVLELEAIMGQAETPKQASG